ncbi:MAG TPA: hypothetical protein VH020_10595 [Stellaceae bacterium]|jgi:hypothetical protein|nr:hypothetical protein [Stellaceae bacterium]
MALAELFPVAARRGPGAAWAWLALLLVAAAVSSVTFACVTPFAAFAVLTAATLPLPRALGAMVAVWLVNQALGFCALGYPLDGSTLAWGGALGVAALAATLGSAAAIAMTPGLWPRLALGFVAAFGVYEGLLYLAALGLGGTENFSPAIVAKVALSDAAWLLGLVILRHLLSHLPSASRTNRHPVTT